MSTLRKLGLPVLAALLLTLSATPSRAGGFEELRRPERTTQAVDGAAYRKRMAPPPVAVAQRLERVSAAQLSPGLLVGEQHSLLVDRARKELLVRPTLNGDFFRVPLEGSRSADEILRDARLRGQIRGAIGDLSTDRWVKVRALVVDGNNVSVRLGDHAVVRLLNRPRALDPAHQTAMAAIVAYAAHSLKTETSLRKLGYQPPSTAAWKNFPDIAKLHMAYWAAEEHSPQKGGQRFLAMMAKQLSQDYPSAAYHPDLKNLLALNQPDEPLEFATPKETPSSLVDPAHRAIVIALAGYMAGPRTVPAHQLLVNFMKIPPVTAYQLLASGTSNEQVFQTAASTLTPAQLEAALPGMAKFVASQFPVANYDTKLQPYLQIPGSPAAPARAGPP